MVRVMIWLNMLIAVLVGTLTVATIAFAVFAALAGCKLRTETRVYALVKFIQGLALCGIVGGIIMQAFGLWIT